MRITNTDRDTIIDDVRDMSSIPGKLIGLRFRRTGRACFSFSHDVRAPVDMFLVFGPLDLAFLDADQRIIDIQRADPLTLDPRTWRLYAPDDPYRYLIEVEAGLLDARDFQTGDRIAFADD